MRKMNLLLVALFTVLSFNVATAQDEEYTTDENLRRYAMMEETIDIMKSEISVALNSMIKNQDGINGKRYTELSKGNGEAASDFEQKFMDNITSMIDDRKTAIKEVNQSLATKMLPDGGKAYKAIKSALASDEAVKARYEGIVAKMKLEESGS